MGECAPLYAQRHPVGGGVLCATRTFSAEDAMDETRDNLTAINKAMIDAANRFAVIALQGAEDMLKVQMNAMKGALADSMQHARTLAEAKDLQSLPATPDKLAQPAMEKATGYLKSVYEVVAEMNRRTAETLDRTQSAAPGSEVAIAAFKSALSAVNTVYDNMLKMSQQMSQMTNANVDAMSGRARRK